MDTTEPIVPTEAPDNRRELLSQQFDEVAQAEPAKFQRDDSGKFASTNDKPLEEPAIISVTLATLSFSAILITSFLSLYHSTNMIDNVKGLS